MKRFITIMLCVLLLLFAFTATAQSPCSNALPTDGCGYASNSAGTMANVRPLPSLNNIPIGALSSNQYVPYTEFTSDQDLGDNIVRWFHIRLPDGRMGWIADTIFVPVSLPRTPTPAPSTLVPTLTPLPPTPTVEVLPQETATITPPLQMTPLVHIETVDGKIIIEIIWEVIILDGN